MPEMPEYDHHVPLNFGGFEHLRGFDDSKIVVLPVPFERTTSYVAGTRNGPREILLASGQVELWDQQTRSEAFDQGIYTLPELEPAAQDMRGALNKIGRVAASLIDAHKFIVILGGEQSESVPIVEALAA